jgi:branched-chain amino acid transport system substrate-binding protein
VGNVGDITFCSSFRKAYTTLGLHLPRYVLGTCQDASILNSPSLDKALAGSYEAVVSRYSKADLAEYATIIKKYDPKASPNPNISTNQAAAVVPVLALYNAMKGSAEPITAAGIKQRLATATNVSLPFSGGLTFTCNGAAIPLLKDICSANAALGIVQPGKAGTVTHITVYNPTPLF